MKYLFLNNENYVCLPPYLWITKTQFDKNKYQILKYHINNTYAKLASDTLQNKKIKSIMGHTGGHLTSPFLSSVAHKT